MNHDYMLYRAEQEQQLQNELNVLEKEFNAKKTKAFEKLVSLIIGQIVDSRCWCIVTGSKV